MAHNSMRMHNRAHFALKYNSLVKEDSSRLTGIECKSTCILWCAHSSLRGAVISVDGVAKVTHLQKRLILRTTK